MRAWLSQRNVALEIRDFFEERFSESELRELLGNHLASDFFSWASPSFRKLNLDRITLSDHQLITMMLDEPRLIRRPLIAMNGELMSPTSGTHKIIQAINKKLQT